MIRDFLDELGAAVEARGMTAVEDDVAVVVAAARAHRLHGVALEVLADRGAPEVARSRALARLAPALVASLRDAPSTAAAAAAVPADPAPSALDAAGPALDAAGR